MKIVDRGGGIPIVVVPGIQGRWEWLEPAIDALASRCRVVTFSLADEPTSGGRFDESLGFASYVEQVREALDAARVRRAAICGVSYGGLIAAAFAARHPDRTSSIVLVSALPPSWRPDARVRFYLRAPRLLAPLFVLASLRMYREFAVASGELPEAQSAGVWDDGRGELDDYRAAVAGMAAEYPGVEMWAAGFSFGSYVAMTVGADEARVCALIGIAPPVDRYDFAPVKMSPKPTFIMHGEDDELISLKLVRHFYAELREPTELVEIDRANHLFDGQAGEVRDALADLLEDFTCRKQ